MLWTPADHTFTSMSCIDSGGARIFVEALNSATETDGICAPPPDIPLDLWWIVLVNIGPWDGQAGTYVVGDGVAQAGYGADRFPVGEVSVEISEPWVPSTLSFTLDGVQGVLDLSGCLSLDDMLPCAPP